MLEKHLSGAFEAFGNAVVGKIIGSRDRGGASPKLADGVAGTM